MATRTFQLLIPTIITLVADDGGGNRALDIARREDELNAGFYRHPYWNGNPVNLTDDLSYGTKATGIQFERVRILEARDENDVVVYRRSQDDERRC